MAKRKTENNHLEEVHCVNDGRFLGKHRIVSGIACFFCPRCKQFTVIQAEAGPDDEG